jgi:mxaJ protein
MAQRRIRLIASVSALLVLASVAVGRAVQRAPAAQRVYHLDLGPARAPIDAAVPSAFDASGKRVAMRVCADPNNLPFSNRAGEGFENKLAALLAADLGLRLEYSWWPQRRGFVRNTLKLGNCDAVMGIASSSELVLPTRPYYRSTYVFVTRRDSPVHIRSLDDPALRRLRIGIHLMGGDDANPPAAQSLARRGLASNVEGFPIYGDYTLPDPPARLLDAVENGAVEVAIVWGPLAGYFARTAAKPLELAPVRPEHDGALPFGFDISVGVRHGDTAWRNELQDALDRHAADIRRLLAEYGVPTERVAAADAAAQATNRVRPR